MVVESSEKAKAEKKAKEATKACDRRPSARGGEWKRANARPGLTADQRLRRPQEKSPKARSDARSEIMASAKAKALKAATAK